MPGHARYEGWLAIPYLDRNSLPLSIRFRNPVPGAEPKYLGLPDEPTRVFNVRAIHEASDTIHIAEGEFDAMILCKCGLPAVAIPGVSNWKSHHRRMLAGFNRVYVWADGDDPGADFGRRVMRSLRSAAVVPVPRGKDVTDLYLSDGEDGLLALIEREEDE